MPGISRRRNLSALRAARDEAGFALAEVMVSAVLLIVLALATLSVIDRAQATSSNNRSRDVAAQLAQSEQDAIRQMPISALAGGFHPPVIPKTVGRIQYQVASEADWVTDSGGAVTCSTSGRVAYLRSTTTVTWAGMGTIKPVIADAIVDPGVAALGPNKGALTVLLSKADGTGTPGITVTAGGVSSVTDENGCAVLANLDAGTQTLSYSAPGYVDKDAKPAPSKPVTIGAGTIAQATGSYDLAGRIDTTIVDDSTTPQPADWGKVALDHAQRSTPTLFATDTDGTFSNSSATVFPFSSSYKAFVGDCTGNDPSNTLYTNAGASPGTQVNPGQTKSVTLTMRNITVDFQGSAEISGATTVIAPEAAAPAMAPVAPQSPCGGAKTYTGLTSATGQLTLPMPYGVWRVCAYKTNNSYTPRRHYYVKTSTPWNSAGTDRAIVNTTSTTTGAYAPKLSTRLARISTSTSYTTGSTLPC